MRRQLLNNVNTGITWNIEEESTKRKESISGNRIIVNILLVVFLVRCYVLNA